jgi:hypothetical protein
MGRAPTRIQEPPPTPLQGAEVSAGAAERRASRAATASRYSLIAGTSLPRVIKVFVARAARRSS